VSYGQRVDDDGLAIGYQALPRGVPVHAADGPQVGTVRQVLDNAREHIFDGIVIDTPEGRRFVDAPEVARIAERRVTLSITAAQAAALPEHEGLRATLGTSARRTTRRWRRRLRL
jgi:Mrp family chromosome partitioning ATPase